MCHRRSGRRSLTQDYYAGLTSYPMNTTDTLHIYELLVDDASISVAVDGVPRLQAIALGSWISTPMLDFGDLLFRTEPYPNGRISTFALSGL